LSLLSKAENSFSQITSGTLPLVSCDAFFVPIVSTAPDSTRITGFKALIKGYDSYHWDFGDGTTDTGFVVAHRFAHNGKYLVSLQVKLAKSILGPCEDTHSLWVNQQGRLNADSLDKPCQAAIGYASFRDSLFIKDLHLMDTLLRDSITVTRMWDFGDGTNGLGAQVGHLYAGPGTYKVKMVKVALDGVCIPFPELSCHPPILCVDTFTTYVIIPLDTRKDHVCEANIQMSAKGKTVSLIDTYPGQTNPLMHVQRVWNWGDSTQSSGDTVSHTYVKAGKYKVSLQKEVVTGLCYSNLPDLACTKLAWECVDTSWIDLDVMSDSVLLVTSIGDNYKEDALAISLFPMPAQTSLNLTIQETNSDMVLRLYTLSGKMTREFVGLHKGTQEIDVSDVDNGIYFYSLASPQGPIKNGKLLISR
jgi:hypothetical protein